MASSPKCTYPYGTWPENRSSPGRQLGMGVKMAAAMPGREAIPYAADSIRQRHAGVPSCP